MSQQPCQAGCNHFTGGEVRHHKDCYYYPNSLTKMYELTAKSLEKAQERINALQIQLDERNTATQVWIKSDTQCRAYCGKLERELEEALGAYEGMADHHEVTEQLIADAQGLIPENGKALLSNINNLKDDLEDAVKVLSFYGNFYDGGTQAREYLVTMKTKGCPR